jgi:hypothetical protein
LGLESDKSNKSNFVPIKFFHNKEGIIIKPGFNHTLFGNGRSLYVCGNNQQGQVCYNLIYQWY